MDELTERQAEILQFIRDAIENNGSPPTRMDICKAMGFKSPNAAEEHLRALERKGAIVMEPGASRGIRLVGGVGLPLIGRVAAGSPILAEANVEARYRIDPTMFKPSADYLLKVRGMSMRDAGIHEGDLLAVHKTKDARTGQVVVARIGNEVTVKRFRRTGGKIQLLPENPEFKAIDVDSRDEFAIEGIAVGVIRNGRAL